MSKEKMNNEALMKYIKKTRYYCVLCGNLKKAIIKNGLTEIDKYDGFICGGIEDMFIRRGKW